ncbi:MAG: hypothetical protein ACOYU4_12415 [Thermodesulfobacteriota bacterium]
MTEEFKQIQLFLVTEADFDNIVFEAGGSRLSVEETQKSGEEQADYVLGKAIIELKLINDEGFQKNERQQKLANLFMPFQADQPVIIIHPALLQPGELRKYFRILETPFKTHIKKAAEQLQTTALKYDREFIRVLILFNNGYTALSIDEFVTIATNRIRNDTAEIDFLITAGLYYYGDGFDYYTIAPFELHPINIGKPWSGFKDIQRSWNKWLNEQMTLLIRNPTQLSLTKLPVEDLVFDLKDKIYVKPAPPIGKPSAFYRNGRPRKNSTGIETYPPVATILPSLSHSDWDEAKRSFDWPNLKDSYKDYNSWVRQIQETEGTTFRPIVPLPVKWLDFVESCKSKDRLDFYDLCMFAAEKSNFLIKDILSRALRAEEITVWPVRYLHLTTLEVGQDMSFDMSTLVYVISYMEPATQRTIFVNERIFHMHALAVTAAYAIKLECPVIVYSIDRRFGWE